MNTEDRSIIVATPQELRHLLRDVIRAELAAVSPVKEIKDVIAYLRLIINPNDEEALKLANDIPFGLSNSVWTKDKKRQQFFIENLESGTVSVNKESSSDPRLPFGGAKSSGYGTELSLIALKEFVIVKTVVGN